MRKVHKVLVLLTVLALLLGTGATVLAAPPEPALKDKAGAQDSAARIRWFAQFGGVVTRIEGAKVHVRTPKSIVVFVTSAATHFLVPGIENATLADTKVGMGVHVTALRIPTLGLLATRVVATREVGLRGIVTAISGTTLTVRTAESDRELLTDDQTRFRVPGVQGATIEDVAIGDTVLVEAHRSVDGTLLARLLAVVAEPLRVRGEVVANEPGVLRVHTPVETVTFATNEGTLVRIPGSINPTLKDVKVGQTVTVFARSQAGKPPQARLVVVHLSTVAQAQ